MGEITLCSFDKNQLIQKKMDLTPILATTKVGGVIMEDEMKEVLERFDKLLKPIFPENAEQRIVENRIVVNWHLNNVPERPNKRSKLIRVTFTHEFLEDYSELSPLKKDKTDAKIRNRIERNFSNFDPDHDKSINSTPPSVEWRIETSDLVY